MRGISALLAVTISSLLAVPSHQASSYQSRSALDELGETTSQENDRRGRPVLGLLSRLLAAWGADQPTAPSIRKADVAQVTQQQRAVGPVSPEESSFSTFGEGDAATSDSRVGTSSFGPLTLPRGRVLRRRGKPRTRDPRVDVKRGSVKRRRVPFPQPRPEQFGRQRRFNPDIPCHFNPITCMDYD